ncbi:DUF4388 domain-containing protein [Deinococcus pimensis]|uniref:DUF4388 domain-containing protein n=1 Tax=Deinococcus pimensis TaxID=309888 RepID=UPI000488C6B1|nr:DUF4388 domain-containing protein [Deinococcus pimensis]
MALTGDLADLPLTDLAHVLAHHTGTLDVERALHGRNLQLILERGRLRALFVDGFNIRDDGRLRDLLRSVAATPSGYWEFHPAPITDALRQVDYALVDLLTHATHTDVPDDHLPHPVTHFVPTFYQDVPQDLRATWTTAAPFLRSGASAETLASDLGMTERDAQRLLYRLRAIGLIQPQRAIHREQHNAAAPASSPGRPAPAANPVARLLGALRRMIGTRA